MPDATMLLRRLPKPFRIELTMNSIVAGLFHEQRIPPGAVVDAGAHDGSWSCLYAVLSKASAQNRPY